MNSLDARKFLHMEQIVTLSIESFNAVGQGVAHYDGITVFVSGALPNELVNAKIVQVKKTYAAANCISIEKAALQRVQPDCPHYGLCGSCQLKHMSYPYSLEFKRQKVVDALCSITKLGQEQAEALVRPTLASPMVKHYRNKLVYNFAPVQTRYAREVGDACKERYAYKEGYADRVKRADKSKRADNAKQASKVKTADIVNTADIAELKAGFVAGVKLDSMPDFKLGFYAPKSHDVVDLVECPAEFNDAYKIRQALREILCQAELRKRAKDIGLTDLFYNEATNTGLFKRLMLRYSDYEKRSLLTFVLNLSNDAYNQDVASFFQLLAKKLAQSVNLAACLVNLQAQATNKIFSDDFRLVYGQPTVKECLSVCKNEFVYELGAADFFQVNPSCASVLFTTALNLLNLSGHERVFDLYCGTGSISLPLASWAKEVIGIEIVESAIVHAKRNQKLNNIQNVEFFAADASFLFPKLFAAGRMADCVVVDPPRKGLDAKTIGTILAMQPKKLLYVSCDPGSLARDLGLLLASGKFKLEVVQPVDMFPGSFHVESVVLMSRID